MSISEFLDRWLADYAKHKVSPKTYERYQEMIDGHIRPAFGSYLLPKLSPLHIQAFYSSSLERGGKDGRVAEGPWYRPSIDAFRDHGGGWRSAS
jgi:hypothetical protein